MFRNVLGSYSNVFSKAKEKIFHFLGVYLSLTLQKLGSCLIYCKKKKKVSDILEWPNKCSIVFHDIQYPHTATALTDRKIASLYYRLIR